LQTNQSTKINPIGCDTIVNSPSQCWYVHVEDMETDQIPEKEANKFECNMCEESFEEKKSFMQHRKNKHTGSNRRCENFSAGKCERNSDECWYVHSEQPDKTPNNQNAIPKEQGFCQAPTDPLPPDQMSRMFWMVNNLVRKVEGMEKRFEELLI
jgi:hypothetical protein